MASKIVARYISRSLSSSGKILSEEEKAAENIYIKVVHDVDRQNIPVRFAITSAGLVGSDGSTHCGAFDITFMSCLPNTIVMAPSNEDDLVNMIATAAEINDRPVCFRYPSGAIVNINNSVRRGVPLECMIEHGALPCLLNLLSHNHKKSIKKEACWIISNVTAGNRDQIQ